jgi:hypothetical protein
VKAGGRRSFGYVAISTALLAAATVAAASALWPIYEGPGLIIVVATSLLMGSAIVIAGARWRWPSYVVILATVGGFVVVGVAVAVPSAALFSVFPTLDGVIQLLSGVARGWKQLLTISLPVGSYEALLVPAFVLVLTSVVVSLSIAIRSSRSSLAVIPSIVVFLVASTLGPQRPALPVVAPLVLLGILLMWLLWMRWHERRAAIDLLVGAAGTAHITATGSGLRTALGAVVIVAVASVAGVGITTLTGVNQDRLVPRTALERPFDPRDYVSPLSGFRQFFQPARGNAVMFTIEGLPAGALVRIATLDNYDGVVYSVGVSNPSAQSGVFERMPGPVDQSGVVGERAKVVVEIVDYEGVWLPIVGDLETVKFAGTDSRDLRDNFFYNTVTSTAVLIDGVRSGDRYELSVVVPDRPSSVDLGRAMPGSVLVPQLTSIPEALAEALGGYVAGIEEPGEQLKAMIAGLRSEGYVSHGISEDDVPSRSGHATDRIAELFDGGQMIGDAEQYAVAASLMAHELGFPARVVMGFDPDSPRVTGADVSAWIEVNTQQFGWLTIDPNPSVRDIPEEPPEEPTQIARPPTIVPPPVIESEPAAPQAPLDSEQDPPPAPGLWATLILPLVRMVGWSLLVLALAASPLLLIVAAKFRRRSLRRRAVTVTDQITGGWREFEDAVVDHGLTPAIGATRSEIATVVGGLPPRVLATVADRAVFAPEDPVAADADRVWYLVEELKKVLDADETRWQRFRARISLRSLGGYSVSDLVTRPKDRP